MEEKKYTILLVEDEGLLSRMYSKKLELDGFTVLVAENGHAALELAQDTDIDLVICDMMMPVMDGLATLQALKSKGNTQNIPVIMLSNVTEEEYVSKAIELGAVDYLVKNKLLPADIVAKVKEVLKTYDKNSDSFPRI